MAIPTAIPPGDRVHAAAARADWRAALPTLETRAAILREVATSDAGSLAAALGNARVLRYLPTGPLTADHFARFIRWVRCERRLGRYLCFGVVPRGSQSARGLFQIWPIEPGFGTAEMGFALDPTLWGTRTFFDCATAVVDFAFGTLSVRRLEFRSATTNGRGTGALLKLGAVPEGTLRSCFPCFSGVLDHTMWSILSHEWKRPSSCQREAR